MGSVTAVVGQDSGVSTDHMGKLDYSMGGQEDDNMDIMPVLSKTDLIRASIKMLKNNVKM